MEGEHDNPQRSPRINVRMEGFLTTSDGYETSVVVIDVSVDGFRIESEDELLPGERVKLRVGKSPAQTGEIKWVIGNEAGGIFLD